MNSQITVEGSAGTASTGIRVKYYTNVIQNATADILYTADAVNGDTFTILTSGVYSISYSASANSNDNFGISKNVSPTVQVVDAGIAPGNILSRCSIPSGNVSCNASWTGFLSVNDVIRAHQEGTSSGTSRLNTFTITKMN